MITVYKIITTLTMLFSYLITIYTMQFSTVGWLIYTMLFVFSIRFLLDVKLIDIYKKFGGRNV